MGDWGYVVAGYVLTGVALAAYVLSLRRRADALRRTRGRSFGDRAA
jgi:hypothetical protein